MLTPRDEFAARGNDDYTSRVADEPTPNGLRLKAHVWENGSMSDITTAIPHVITTVESQPAVWIAGPTCTRCDVAGEAYNREQMQRIVHQVHARTDHVLPAWLSEEPENRFDANAIMVWVSGGKVGYLPTAVAARWKPVLKSLAARYGHSIACQATVDPPSAANQGGYGMVLWLPPLPAPPPEERAPLSISPAGAASVRRIPGFALSQAAVAPPQAREQALPPAPVPEPASKPQPPPPPPPPSSRHEPAPASPAPELSPEQLAELKAELSVVEQQLETARAELSCVEEALDIQSFGFYQPRYGFESSAHYVARLKSIREEQKSLIKDGKAAPCDLNWTVRGSAAEGKKMIRQQVKLMLRAFNGECDAAVAKVTFSNVTTLEKRMEKAYDAINKLAEVQRVFISRRYLELKLAELHLVHEHRERVHEEKQELAQNKARLREEQKAREEIEQEMAAADQAEAAKQAQLAKLRAELEASIATEQQHERLEGLVSRLETELADALDRKAKAIARAQLTKSGYVYVLSNIGAFGDGVYKIGLTRRLDPLERVAELGDASVPFPFDVHAIIFSEDAPALEGALHHAFAAHRVNAVNARKEYFRVSLDMVRAEVQELHGLVSFQLEATAEEYRRTVVALEAAGAA